MNFIDRLWDVVLGKSGGESRSTQWPKVRKAFLAANPFCAVCGGRKMLEAHHIKPFHLFPSEELNPNNLIALCEGNPWSNCHLLFGHLGNFTSWNSNVVADAAWWKSKIGTRPS